MKCQILFSGKNKKSITNFLPAEIFTQLAVKALRMVLTVCCYSKFFFIFLQPIFPNINLNTIELFLFLFLCLT